MKIEKFNATSPHRYPWVSFGYRWTPETDDEAEEIRRMADAGLLDGIMEPEPEMDAPAGTEIEMVEAILREAIDLAKPDDLAFLELQVPSIARDIVCRLIA
jgi:hypothetical protein